MFTRYFRCLVDGAADFFAAQCGDDALDLPPVAEAGDIALVDRPEPRSVKTFLDDAPPRPDHSPDTVDLVEATVGPVGISGIVRLNRHTPSQRVQGYALDDQRVVDAKHVNAVAQPLGSVC